MCMPTNICNIFACYSLPVLLIGLVHLLQKAFSCYQIITKGIMYIYVIIHSKSQGCAIKTKLKKFFNLARKDNNLLVLVVFLSNYWVFVNTHRSAQKHITTIVKYCFS